MYLDFPTTLHVKKLYADIPDTAAAGMTLSQLLDLCTKLKRTPVPKAQLLGLLGSPPTTDRRILTVLEEANRSELVNWLNLWRGTGVISMVILPAEKLLKHRYLNTRHASFLLGHGHMIATCGLTEEPLTDLSVSQLRENLSETERILNKTLPYRTRALLPRPDAQQRRFDPVVLEEIYSQNFNFVLTTNYRNSLGSNHLDPPQNLTIEPTYSVRTDEDTDILLEALGHGNRARFQLQLRRGVRDLHERAASFKSMISLMRNERSQDHEDQKDSEPAEESSENQ